LAGLKTRQRKRTPTTTEPTRVDLWPDDFGLEPWRQSGTSGEACSAFAVGAAAYWLEVTHHDADPDTLGTPDFSFIYNNEAFLESSVVSFFHDWWETGQRPMAPSGFDVEIAARVAAVFGVRFLPRYTDYTTLEYSFKKPPPFHDFLQAGERLHVFRHVFQPAIFDPNDLPDKPPERITSPRHPEVRRTLAAGKPVVMAFCRYDGDGFSAGGDLLPLPEGRGEPTSAHAVLLVGYDDAKKGFRFRNSWGPEWGTRGYGTIPYDWIDDEEATFGFITVSPTDGAIRRRVMFERLTIKNLRATTMRVSVKGYDGRRTYLGGHEVDVDPSKSAVLYPVRWTETYRLVVKAWPKGAERPSRAIEWHVTDKDGAVASGAEVVVPPSERRLPKVRFLRADGKRALASKSRETAPAGP
jgi:hypothetical protein